MGRKKREKKLKEEEEKKKKKKKKRRRKKKEEEEERRRRRRRPIIASVVKNEGMPIFVVNQPLKTPTATPVARPAIIPANGPAKETANATVTLARPATAPTERSISPADNTNVIAIAITAIIAVCRTMLSRLLGFRNPLSFRVRANIRKIAIKPIYIIFWRQSLRNA